MTPPSSVDLGPYTARARAAMRSARELARAHDHHEVATGHVLLGLVTGPGRGMAGLILTELSVAPEVIERDVQDGMPLGEGASEERIPFSDGTRTALELASHESPGTGPNRIGSDHLLIGLLREGGFAAGVLDRHGVSVEGVVAARDRLRPVQCYGCAEYDEGPEPPAEPEWVAPAEVEAFDERLAETRRLKEEAIDAQDFERAAHIREAEKDLLHRRYMFLERNSDEFDLPSAIDEFARLRKLVDHLRGLLHRGHGADGLKGE